MKRNQNVSVEKEVETQISNHEYVMKVGLFTVNKQNSLGFDYQTTYIRYCVFGDPLNCYK